MGHGEKKTKRLDQFIAAMLKHGTVEAAATVAGIAASTAHRWLKDPEVIRRLAEARRDAMNRAIARLQEAASGAVDCLCEIQEEGESESARVSASRCILEQAMRAAELGDLAERIAKLEAIAQNRTWRGAGNEQPSAGNRGINGHA